MKILLIGKNGQVGWELQRSLSTLGDVVAVDYFDKELCGDLTNLEGIAQTVRTVRPDVVVNAAAHIRDKAESERELSDLLNDKGVAVLAAESAKLGPDGFTIPRIMCSTAPAAIIAGKMRQPAR